MTGKFRFGVAKDIITPCIKATMMGFGSVYGEFFQGIHDDLYVRTLLLQDEENSIILISADLLFHDDSLADKLRDYTFKKYNVPKDNLLIIYTHTHYGPAVKGYDFVHYKNEYEDFIYERMTQCIDRAFLNISDGIMEYKSIGGEWNISRRLKINGKVDPSILPNPEGEIDKNMYVLKLSDVHGNIRSIVVNFSCHPSNLNGYKILSSEYPGRLCQLIESQNYGCTALFFQGCGGDSKLKIGAKSSKFHPISYDECNEVATSMALRIQNELIKSDWLHIDIKLRSAMFKIKMPLEVSPKSFFEKEWQELKGSALMQNCAQYVIDNYDQLPDYVMLNCGIIQLSNEVYIFTVGGEPSYDVKRVLSKLLPEKIMIFFGYNDAIAYVPSDKMLKEGGYEAGGRSVTEYRLKGKFKEGIDRKFIEGFKSVLLKWGIE